MTYSAAYRPNDTYVAVFIHVNFLQFDCGTIAQMNKDDLQLLTSIPAIGDRLALRNYCQKLIKQNDGSESSQILSKCHTSTKSAARKSRLNGLVNQLKRQFACTSASEEDANFETSALKKR